MTDAESSKIKAMREEKAALRKEIDKAKDELAGLRSKYGALAERMAEARKENERLKNLAMEKDDKIEGLQRALKSLVDHRRR